MADWREQAKAALEESMGHGYSSLDNLLDALVDAVEPIIVREVWKTGTPQQVREVIEAEVRERIAQEIEALPWDLTTMSQQIRGRTTFTRAQAYARAAHEARGGESE